MNLQELTRLREQILSDVAPMVLDAVSVGADRFSLLLRLIQAGGADEGIYKKAYESAKAIDDKEEQLSALMALLDEVDFDIQKESDGEPRAEQSRPHDEQQPAASEQGGQAQQVEGTQY